MQDKYLETIKRQLAAGRLNRRQFISSSLVAGIALPTAMGMASNVMAGTPKRGGTFRLGIPHGSTTDSLDPGTHENGMSQGVCYAYCNHLMEVGPNGQLRPELAESAEPSNGAKTWRFNIRQGVEFHNGKTLTPQDVVTSFRFHMGEDSKSAGKGLLTSVTDIKIEGNAVIFELSAGNADFGFITSDYHFAIMPDKDGQLDWSAGIGTGPYIMDSYEPGVRAKMHRNPNYWKPDSAHFDDVEFISVIDTVARQNAIMNGDVDVIARVDPKTVHLLGRNPNVNILETTGTLHYTFPMRVTAAPFDNYDFRMACKLSVDREELVTKILSGHGALGNDHPISTANPYHNGNLAQRAYDPDKAAFHLKKAGYDGGNVQLSSSDAAFAGAVDAALLIKESAAKAGLNIEVVREPKDGYWSNVWNKKPWGACYWGGRPTEDWMFGAAYVNDTKWNDTDWRTGEAADRFNHLVKAARSETNTDLRREMYHECQALVNDDGGALIPMFANNIHALGKNVMHSDDVAANWELDGGKAAERWWFA
ncbi:MAG: ABC transporter substrate-binding protein [Gammaproteobacteria bacterium]|nr:ABC transporter substrate-binding protein [Gammaproteobacteria bacterium]MCP4880233.1 ABC transporter substrate-binding protein [Gammaproteobacteria bacterium]